MEVDAPNVAFNGNTDDDIAAAAAAAADDDDDDDDDDDYDNADDAFQVWRKIFDLNKTFRNSSFPRRPKENNLQQNESQSCSTVVDSK